MRTTPNLSLKVWNNANDEFNPQDLSDNWDALDAQFSPTSIDVRPSRFIESGATLPTTSLSDGYMFYLTAAASGFPSKTLVRYNGTTWAAVGPSEVQASLPVSNLYDGRTVFLTSASGGFPARVLVIYNSGTTSWERIGGIELSATVPASNNYAGRSVILTAAVGGFDAYSHIIYDGTAYKRAEKRGVEIGTGLPGSPYAGQVFALTAATGNFKSGDVVRYNGTVWTKVGPGTPLLTSAQLSAYTPSDGEEIALQVDATNGVNWHLRYNAASASTYKWESLSENGMRFLAETPAAISYADGTTWYDYATPVQLVVPRSGDYIIKMAVRRHSMGNSMMKYAVKLGAATISQDDGIHVGGQTTTGTGMQGYGEIVRTLTAGDTIKLQTQMSTTSYPQSNTDVGVSLVLSPRRVI